MRENCGGGKGIACDERFQLAQRRGGAESLSGLTRSREDAKKTLKGILAQRHEGTKGLRDRRSRIPLAARSEGRVHQEWLAFGQADHLRVFVSSCEVQFLFFASSRLRGFA
jgi:hypothetical protein